MLFFASMEDWTTVPWHREDMKEMLYPFDHDPPQIISFIVNLCLLWSISTLWTTAVVWAKSPMKEIWQFFPLVPTSHKGCKYKMVQSEISMKVAKKTNVYGWN